MKVFKLPLHLLGEDIEADDGYIDEAIDSFNEYILQKYTRVAIAKDKSHILLYKTTPLVSEMRSLFSAENFLKACLRELGEDEELDVERHAHLLEIVYGYITDEYTYYINSLDFLVDKMHDYANAKRLNVVELKTYPMMKETEVFAVRDNKTLEMRTEWYTSREVAVTSMAQIKVDGDDLEVVRATVFHD